MVHYCLAKDIVRVSSQLLFAETPRIQSLSAQTQSRLDDILKKNNFPALLLQAGEIASAYGGVYITINYDPEVLDVPIINVVNPDCGYHMMRWNTPTDFVFIREIFSDENKIYRHMERRIKGYILNELWLGDAYDLGVRIELTDRPETESILAVVEVSSATILAVYVPNKLPNLDYGSLGIGVSDLQGLESMLDSLDEAYTGWVKDIRLGAGKLIVPDSILTHEDEQTPYFDNFKEIFTILPTNIMDMDNAGKLIQNIQFAVRSGDYQIATESLISNIVTVAGYSPQSFGIQTEGTSAESGYALKIRERKSVSTTMLKSRYWIVALNQLLSEVILADNLWFSNHNEPQLGIEMFDGVPDDTKETAGNVIALYEAGLISKERAIRLLNPDWSDAQIIAELQKISEDTGNQGTNAKKPEDIM